MMYLRKPKLVATKALLLGCAMSITACEVTLVEDAGSRNIRQARSSGDSAATEQLLRQALASSRKAKLRAVSSYELGRLLYEPPTNAQRRQEGLQLLSSAANANYPAAQRKLGEIYANGDGVQKDLNRAVAYYRQAAAGGHGGAQIDLATFLRQNPSYGSPNEAAQLASNGIAHLRRDSSAGNANSSRKLGQIYRDGVIVARNRAESERYFALAVEQGQRKAVTDLAELWINGSPNDQQRALRLLEMGADRNIERAVVLLGDLYRDGSITAADRDRALAYYLRGTQGSTGYDESTVSRVASTLRRGGVSKARRQEGIAYLQQAAKGGSGRAALELGKIYEASGSYSSAARYYRSSLGYSEAKLRLGRMLYDGKGVTRNYGKAVPLLEAAHRAGHSSAAAYLGRAYAEGNGVAQNWGKARGYLEKGVRGGSTAAAVLLAEANEKGLGGPVNLTEAFRLYKIAAERGSVTGMQKVAEAYRTGRGVAINAAQARRWTDKAAGSGSSSALIETGWAYATGDGVPRDMAEANRYFERAVKQDPSKAGQIARALRDGSRGGVTDPKLADYYGAIARSAGDTHEIRNAARTLESSDPVQAEQAYLEAARKGDAVAMMWLADREFARSNPSGGVGWLERAAQGGSGTAAVRLGAIYAFGDGVPVNLSKALKFYLRGAELGNGEAMFWVGSFYRQGLGVPVNKQLADEWLAKARAAGYRGNG